MISPRDIRRVIGEPYFSRGEEYLHQGKVQSVEVSADRETVTSTVSGSGLEVYDQDIDLSFTPAGGLHSVSGACSCPVGFNCKHVAAALLSLADRPAPEVRVSGKSATVQPSGDGDTLHAGLRLWLGEFAGAMEPRKDDPGAGSSEEQLYYVFRLRKDGQPEIMPYRVWSEGKGSIRTQECRNIKAISFYWTFLTLEDITILAKLSHFSDEGWPRNFKWPEGENFFEFLKEIMSTGRARAEKARGPVLTWGPPRRFKFEWVMNDQGDQHVETCVEDGEKLTVLPFPTLVYLDASDGLIGVVETDLPAPLAGTLARAPSVPAAAAGVFADELVRIGGEHVPRPRALDVTRRTDIVPRPVLKLKGVAGKIPAHLRVYFGEGGSDYPSRLIYPCVQIEVVYEGEGLSETARCCKGGDLQFVTERGITVVARDDRRELDFAAWMEDIAEDFGGGPPESFDFRIRNIPKEVRRSDVIFPPVPEGASQIHESLVEFTAEAVPFMREKGWRVEIEDTWPFRLREDPVVFGASINTVSEDRFSLSLVLEARGEEVDVIPIILSVIDSLPVNDSGKLEDNFEIEEFLSAHTIYPKLKDGSAVRFETRNLAPLIKAFLETQGLTEFHKAEAGRAAAFAEAIEGAGVVWKGGKEILELGERLRALATAGEIDPPSSMRGTLRPYQKLGYGWLLSLCESGFGGVLADDMGLGKTVQALALLAHRHLENGSDRPSLLIVPTSLVGNWMREAARFVPDLKILALMGAERSKRFGEITGHHLVLTTYPLINRDHKTLFSHEYDLAILDEAQAVKNPTTVTARRIREINARQRVALTGTPMENNLQELWSLYDWLVPGLLGDRRTFNRHYRTPIEKRGDRARQLSLSTRVKPFLLRRAKEDVARDLPPKTEIDEIVPITETQRALYETIRVAMDERVREAVRAKGIAGSHITILDALLKLRQVCCDPQLVKLAAAKDFTDSAKRERLFELLEGLVAEGRKVLVFSQFVEMLRLIERDVRGRGWSYAMLHGRTKKRDVEITKFQEGQAQLFLVSLKAGGVGLNLTAADTVILYDPWWNPAVER